MKGFSFIEVLISSLIASLVFITVFYLLNNIRSYNDLSKEKIYAYFLLEEATNKIQLNKKSLNSYLNKKLSYLDHQSLSVNCLNSFCQSQEISNYDLYILKNKLKGSIIVTNKINKPVLKKATLCILPSKNLNSIELIIDWENKASTFFSKNIKNCSNLKNKYQLYKEIFI